MSSDEQNRHSRLDGLSRQGLVYYKDEFAGIIEETSDGTYRFTYEPAYLESPHAKPISLSLPLKKEAYTDKILFAFFDGLIPEGWLLDIALKSWKINPRDRMGLLLACCKDTIGAVSVESDYGAKLAIGEGSKSEALQNG